MAMLVRLLGWQGDLPGDTRWRYLHVRRCELPTQGGPLLLVGQQALEEGEPSIVANWVRAGRRRVLLCVTTCESRVVVPWLRIAGIRMISLDLLQRELIRVATEFELDLLHWPLEPEDWLPASVPQLSRDSLAWDFLKRLPEIYPVHDVEAWAESCSLTYAKLRTALLEATGFTPGALYLLYVKAQIEAADRDDVARADLAQILGYSDPSCLGHALRRAKKILLGREGEQPV